jgi:hypothetical protein
MSPCMRRAGGAGMRMSTQLTEHRQQGGLCMLPCILQERAGRSIASMCKELNSLSHHSQRGRQLHKYCSTTI